MKLISSVDTFGAVDADADTLLEQCFQDHEAYLAAMAHDRFLIIGRKGSGKTAIFKKIIKTSDYNVFTFGHTFRDYPWAHHDPQASQGVPEEDRFTHSWKYLILLTASKILLNNDQSQPWDDQALDAMKRLEDFVVDSYGSRDPDLTQFFTPSRVLRINPSLQLAYEGLQATASLDSVSMSELPRYAQDVNRSILNAVISSLNPDNRYYICFDELDIGFDASDPLYAQRLTGLLIAARDITQASRNFGKKLSTIIFLRDDIYQTLRFEDKNKMSENYVSRIEWDSSRTSWTLKKLMEKRFQITLELESENAWSEVFDEEQDMRGRQKNTTIL